VIQAFQLLDIALQIGGILAKLLLQAGERLQIGIDVAGITVVLKIARDRGNVFGITRDILHIVQDVADQCCFRYHSHVLISLVKEGSLGSLLTKPCNDQSCQQSKKHRLRSLPNRKVIT
jgi:hypothetical protein